MPTAKSAAPRKPNTRTPKSDRSAVRSHLSAIQPDRPTLPEQPGAGKSNQPRRPGRLVTAGLGVLMGMSLVLPASTLVAPIAAGRAAPNSCSGWSSTSRPPTSIRVLLVHRHRVIRVPFRKYVVTVMGKEWPSYLPQQVIEAGAVAVKQYAWYHALYSSRRTAWGQCYDVKDSTGDQLYKPDRARIRPDHHRAVDATWGVHLLKNGRLFMTGYRRGDKVRCGKDRTGYKLYARSAVQCARRGYNYRDILRTYYSPNLQLVGNGSSSQSASRAAARPSSSAGSAVADAAAPKPNAGRPVATRRPAPESSAPAKPVVANEPAAVVQPTWGGGLNGGVGAPLATEANAPGRMFATLAFSIV